MDALTRYLMARYGVTPPGWERPPPARLGAIDRPGRGGATGSQLERSRTRLAEVWRRMRRRLEAATRDGSGPRRASPWP